MKALKRTFVAATILLAAVSLFCFGTVSFNTSAASKSGIYWVCLEESNIGEGPGFVSWTLSFLPNGYTCTLNGDELNFHDLGTPYLIAGLWGSFALLVTAVALLVRALIKRHRNRSSADLTHPRLVG